MIFPDSELYVMPTTEIQYSLAVVKTETQNMILNG